MGKITDALEKVQKQREIQKQAWRKRQEALLDERKDTILPEEQKPQVAKQPQEAAQKPTLEERVKYMQKGYQRLHERLKNQVYIAKATDDSGIDPRVVTYFNQSAPISEQYRILRTNIQSKTLSRAGKAFVVSSSFHGEGKTVTAVNLAVALSQDYNKKVFLADCDLRGGNIHQLLNLSLRPGLSDVLANGTASDAAYRNSKINNLTVLTRGEIPMNPSELLGSRRMKRLLEELRTRFDYIILDSPPSISITDTSILGSQTDGVIFVVQAQKTQENTVRHAQELLQQAHAKIVGFVLTQVDHSSSGYYSYYYHYRNNGKEAS